MSKPTVLLHCVPEFADQDKPFTSKYYYGICGAVCDELTVESWNVVVGDSPARFVGRDILVPNNDIARALFGVYEVVQCPDCLAHKDLELVVLGAA